MSEAPERGVVARSGSWMGTMKAVGWSFVGLRKRSDLESDGARLNPIHIIVVAFAGVFVFVVGHLMGNLQVFAGPDKLNAYAAFLKSQPLLLWGARLGLLVMAQQSLIGSPHAVAFLEPFNFRSRFDHGAGQIAP